MTILHKKETKTYIAGFSAFREEGRGSLCVPCAGEALAAVGAAAIPAAHVYFLERDSFASFASESAPPAWRKVLADPETPFAFADTVHGALRTYDWIDLAQ